MLGALDYLSLFFLVLATAILIRNEWVYRRQGELNYFDGDGHVIRRYHSYNEMMCRFWVWDVKKLRRQ